MPRVASECDPLVLAQLLYAFALLLLCARMINTLKVNKGVGVLVIMLGEMIPQISMWFAIALCITMGCSLFFTVVMPAATAFEPEIGWPAYQPFWGLLGNLELDLVSTYIPTHVHEPSATIVPFVLWCYSFVATVVLVNLLIAQMSSIYSAVEERSSEFWTFSFVSSTVLEYKDSRELYPAPLNALSLLLLLPTRLARALGWLGPPSTQTAEGYVWTGSGSSLERQAEGRWHRRRQATMTARYLRQVEEEEALSLKSQVATITERQAEAETKQETRLESVASSLSSIKEGLHKGGLIASPSPYPRKRDDGGRGATGASGAPRGATRAAAPGAAIAAAAFSKSIGERLQQHRLPPQMSEAEAKRAQQPARLAPLREPSAAPREPGAEPAAAPPAASGAEPTAFTRPSGPIGHAPSCPPHIAAKLQQQQQQQRAKRAAAPAAVALEALSAAAGAPASGGADAGADAITAAFRSFDCDGSGAIDVGELRLALGALGLHADSEETSEILRRYDADRNSTIDQREFTKLVKDVMRFQTHQRQDSAATLHVL